MKMVPPTFTGIKVEKYPQGFLDELKKIFQVIQASVIEEVSFTAYLLKDITYQWYEKWYKDKGDMEEKGLWKSFSNAFLDCFFSQALRESKMKEVVNLKQGKMSIREYALMFHQLSRYAPDLVADMRS